MVDCDSARLSSSVVAGCVLVWRRDEPKGEDVN
jgi:hypothetical protein